jgi:hypothetical protein
MLASTVVHKVMTARISEPQIYLELWMVMTTSDANCDIDATTGAGAEDKDNIDHPGTAIGAQPQDPHVNFKHVERH